MLTAADDAFAARLKRGEPFGLGWLSLGSPALAELAAGAGIDALVVDMQHGLFDRAGLEAVVGRSGALPVVVRVEENAAPAISRALDSGADAVLVPLVETPEATAEAVAAARFPPAGKRSGGGVRPLGIGFNAYLEMAAGIAVGVMIETAAGVDGAEAIAAVPGLDFILIGTGDLGLSYAGSGDAGALKEAGCARVLAACRAAGIPCGIFTPSAAEAVRRRAEGYALTVLANDIDVVAAGFAAAAAAFRT